MLRCRRNQFGTTAASTDIVVWDYNGTEAYTGAFTAMAEVCSFALINKGKGKKNKERREK